MKKYFVIGVGFLGIVLFGIHSAHAVPGATPQTYGLHEGDIVGTGDSDDPDIFIINTYGYKRIFLNPVIFNYYGHLGGFSAVRKISHVARDQFETSMLVRNCEIQDQRVFAIEVSGEDEGILHHVAISGEDAISQDHNFFKKVFCINTSEFNWYTIDPITYTTIHSIPIYRRSGQVVNSFPRVCTGKAISASAASASEITIVLTTEYCDNGVAIEISKQPLTINSTQESVIDVAHVSAQGQTTLRAGFCDFDNMCLNAESGQKVYWRLRDLDGDTIIDVGQYFSAL